MNRRQEESLFRSSFIHHPSSFPGGNHETHRVGGGGVGAGGARSDDRRCLPYPALEPPVPDGGGSRRRRDRCTPWGKPPAGIAVAGTGGLAVGAGRGGRALRVLRAARQGK